MPDSKSLHRKLAQVMYEAERIPKRGKAPAIMGGYPFVQVGDAADFIRKALAEKVISMVPTHVQVVGQVDRPTQKGGIMTTVDLIVDWTLTDGESGETITIQSFGAGADGGDKYSGKATTSAMKYALLSGFLLSTGEDSELGSHEAQRPPDPDPSRVDRSTGEIRTIADAEAQPFPATVEGKVAFSNKAPVDGNYRQTPEGLMYGFVVEAEGGKRLQVVATHLAEALQAVGAPIKGQWVTVEGLIERIAWKKDGRDMPAYQRMTLSRIVTPEYTLPAPKGLAPEDLAELETLPWPDSLPEVPA